jgi:hypothetical protein
LRFIVVTDGCVCRARDKATAPAQSMCSELRRKEVREEQVAMAAARLHTPPAELPLSHNSSKVKLELTDSAAAMAWRPMSVVSLFETQREVREVLTQMASDNKTAASPR